MTNVVSGLSFPVILSVVTNLTVIVSMVYRCQRVKATHIFIFALAVSDIAFSLAIHPMLAATSFGVPAKNIFSKSGTPT